MNAGASFVLLTVTVNASSTNAPARSVTRSVTEWSPTSPLSGVPDSVAVPSPLSTSVSHAGSAGAVTASVSPTSTSSASIR